MGTVLRNIPKEAEITRVEYEGPRIALYTRNPKFLQQNGYIISDIVNNVKKCVVVRTDKTIRKPE
jgi:predicted metal-dependent RNase